MRSIGLMLHGGICCSAALLVPGGHVTQHPTQSRRISSPHMEASDPSKPDRSKPDRLYLQRASGFAMGVGSNDGPKLKGLDKTYWFEPALVDKKEIAKAEEELRKQTAEAAKASRQRAAATKMAKKAARKAREVGCTPHPQHTEAHLSHLNLSQSLSISRHRPRVRALTPLRRSTRRTRLCSRRRRSWQRTRPRSAPCRPFWRRRSGRRLPWWARWTPHSARLRRRWLPLRCGC